MELAPEERQRIYEEEKVRLEIREQLQRESGRTAHPGVISMEETKECPKCHEKIKKAAETCKHCGAKFDLKTKLNELGNGCIGCGCLLTLIPLVLVLLAAII